MGSQASPSYKYSKNSVSPSSGVSYKLTFNIMEFQLSIASNILVLPSMSQNYLVQCVRKKILSESSERIYKKGKRRGLLPLVLLNDQYDLEFLPIKSNQNYVVQFVKK